MASWQYAFLFPKAAVELKPENGLRCLSGFGAELDGSIRMCVPIDEHGHLLDVGEEIKLKRPFEKGLLRHFVSRKSFSFQLRNESLALSIQIMPEASNPHISIGWSRRLFEQCPRPIQTAFWKAIRSFSKACDAAYVIIVDDAPDQFEDRFLEIDGKRVFDLQVTHGYGLSIREVWAQISLGSQLPEGAVYSNYEEIGDGYQRYRLVE